jgi:hypothetical protein
MLTDSVTPSTGRRQLIVERSTDAETSPPFACDRGHEPADLELVNTRGDRPGRVLQCPTCACKLLVTPGRLVGGPTTWVVRPPQR